MTLPLHFEYISQYLYYDETSASGLRWKITKGPKAKKDSVAGSQRKDGYWVIRVNRVLYLAHRLVWLLCMQELDDTKVINHVDNNPANNNLDNLEECTQSLNMLSTKMHTGRGLRTDNKTGISNIQELDNGSGNIYARVTWTINGKQHKKSFSYKKLGKETAWKEAIKFKASLS